MNTSLLPLSLSRANGKYVMTLRQTGTPLLPSRLNRFAPPTISESDDGICSCLPESQSRRGGGGSHHIYQAIHSSNPCEWIPRTIAQNPGDISRGEHARVWSLRMKRKGENKDETNTGQLPFRCVRARTEETRERERGSTYNLPNMYATKKQEIQNDEQTGCIQVRNWTRLGLPASEHFPSRGRHVTLPYYPQSNYSPSLYGYSSSFNIPSSTNTDGHPETFILSNHAEYNAPSNIHTQLTKDISLKSRLPTRARGRGGGAKGGYVVL